MRSNRIRTTALAATALLAALSLTACSGDDGDSSDNGKAGSSASAADATGKQSSSPTAAPDKDGTDADSDSGTGSTSGNSAAPAKSGGKNTTGSTDQAGSTKTSTPVTCVGENTKITVSKVSRPINHLLLTMTNTGSRTCYAYYAPKLRFDDAQAVFPILDDSKPQAVVTLQPGQSAYAAIGLAGEDDQKNLHKATRLGVHFSSKNPAGDTGTAPAELTLPADTYWGDNGFVTYWQTEMADALTY
ncbi:DUF4232 domain-containing protein [Streptomyces sp. NPDC058231]|uniref:DUF4232 domain-containing protein n=1 Tax=Streptomyces sp. NPDC058231 TaxID=3346392 RepID=UPI0036ED5341